MYENAPKSSWDEIKETIEGTLGKKVEDIFESIEEEPLSSASIAQVHVARLKTGEKVAVKVQHQWLKEDLPIDTKMVEFLVNLGQKVFNDFNYGWLLDDLKRNLPQELNFEIEARNAIKMKELFKGDQTVKIPKVYQDFSNVRRRQTVN